MAPATDSAPEPPAAAAAGASLQRLRTRLTAWYVATFAIILALLGAGMFATITRQYDTELDASLRTNAEELARVAALRSDHLLDSTELRFADRELYVATATGRSVAGPPLPPWLGDLARESARQGPLEKAASVPVTGAEPRLLRAYAQPFTRGADTLVAIAAGDEVEIEDRYTNLIVAFAIAAVAATLLVGLGGWIFGRKATAPVERSMELRRRFMADAAHELRTPLTVLRTRAEVTLQRPRDAGEYEEALRGIARESGRLGRIIEDLLMLARADAGDRPIDRQRVFLDDIALDAADAIRALADHRSITLTLDELQEAPINADPALVRQLVVILLDNAIKYTAPHGTVRVAVTSTDGRAMLRVADDGIGISEADLPNVFNRFWRADAARSRDGTSSEGVGLGLSIARWIADEHSASLTLESTPGQGTAAVAAFPSA